MASSPHTQREEAGDDPVNIQLGIFIPPQTTKIRKRPKQPRTSVESESKIDQENNETNVETNGTARGKRKRLDSVESVDDESPSTPGAKRLEHNTESKETSGKSKRKRKKRKKKRKPTKEEPSVSNAGATEKERALEYLTSWDSGSSGWTFRKKIQYWLLQNAYDRHKVPKAEFKMLLRYLERLKGNRREMAIVRAQDILHQSVEDSFEITSQRRRLHKRARAVLKVLV